MTTPPAHDERVPPDTAAPDMRAPAADEPVPPPAQSRPPDRPHTLAIDIGGTGLKASVLDAAGAMVADRVRVPTTYPMPPDGKAGMVSQLTRLVAALPEADRVSAGFPGMVRGGVILSAAHFVTKEGPGTEVDPGLFAAWTGFDMASALEGGIGKPTRVANDADVQGLAVVTGAGLELVLTLGTGFGTSYFLNGALMPHLEIAHQPFRKGETYNEQVGEQARKDVGEDRWKRRVVKAVVTMRELFFYDRLFIGGGNAKRLTKGVLGTLEGDVTIVDNAAGILGGVKLWEGRHLGV
jgi:polyphosphate glucokinase